MLDKGVLDILAALTKRPEAPLRLNGAWGLMVCFSRRNSPIVVTIKLFCFNVCFFLLFLKTSMFGKFFHA